MARSRHKSYGRSGEAALDSGERVVAREESGRNRPEPEALIQRILRAGRSSRDPHAGNVDRSAESIGSARLSAVDRHACCRDDACTYISFCADLRDGCLVHVIRDTELEQIAFFTPPDTRDTVKVIADVLGGSYWSTGYLVESGFDQPVKLLEGATASSFADLNGDGAYEAIAWKRRPDDQRCRFGLFGVRVEQHLRTRWPAIPLRLARAAWRVARGHVPVSGPRP